MYKTKIFSNIIMVVGCLKFNLENGSFMLIQTLTVYNIAFGKDIEVNGKEVWAKLCELKFPFSKAKKEERKVLKTGESKPYVFLESTK